MDRCDLFLNFLNESPNNTKDEDLVVKNLLPKLQEIENKEGNGLLYYNTDYRIVLKQIVSHLEKEGFIETVEQKVHSQDKEGNPTMSINIKFSFNNSRRCISRDGYKGQKKRENQEKTQTENNEREIRLLTFFLAVGSIGLLVLEFLKFLFDYVY